MQALKSANLFQKTEVPSWAFLMDWRI